MRWSSGVLKYYQTRCQDGSASDMSLSKVTWYKMYVYVMYVCMYNVCMTVFIYCNNTKFALLKWSDKIHKYIPAPPCLANESDWIAYDEIIGCLLRCTDMITGRQISCSEKYIELCHKCLYILSVIVGNDL